MASTPPSARFRAVLFDLDGTLVDHFATLFRCYEYTLTRLGLPVPAPEVVRGTIGGSMEVSMRNFVADERLLPDAFRLWREHFSATYLDDVSLMPGAAWLVANLHRAGLRLAVLTNKIGEHSRGICRHLGLEPQLAFVLGAGDTPYRKPQREFTLAALARLGAAAGETCLVGDSPYDIDGAHAAGLPAFCVATGTHSDAELRAARADGVHPDLFALGAAVFALPPAR